MVTKDTIDNGDSTLETDNDTTLPISDPTPPAQPEEKSKELGEPTAKPKGGKLRGGAVKKE
jgi:hypothetical protein